MSSRRSSTGTLHVSEDLFYLFGEQMAQASDHRLESAPTSLDEEERQAPRYPPASSDENDGGQRPSNENQVIPRKPVVPTPSLVAWNGPQDPQNPINWSAGRKRTVIAALCCISFSVSLSSSVFAPAVLPVAAEFQVSQEVGILGISLFVLGFAAGKYDVPAVTVSCADTIPQDHFCGARSLKPMGARSLCSWPTAFLYSCRSLWQSRRT